jgi:hypothetical protein
MLAEIVRADQVHGKLKFDVMQYLINVRDHTDVSAVSIEQQIATVLNMAIQAGIVAEKPPAPVKEIADVAVLRLALEDMHRMYGACASLYDFEDEFNDDVEHYIDAARAELTKGGA